MKHETWLGGKVIVCQGKINSIGKKKLVTKKEKWKVFIYLLDNIDTIVYLIIFYKITYWLEILALR